MMKLEVKRIAKRETYTIGKMYINGQYFCDTIEDKDRGLNDSMTELHIKELKVYGKTAIPVGTYEVKMTMSAKYKRVMPEVLNVKGYSGIRIHSGNTAEDSLGCILLGKNKAVGKVLESRATCDAFYKVLNGAVANGEKIMLTIA